MKIEELISSLVQKRQEAADLKNAINSLEDQIELALKDQIEQARKEKGDRYGVIHVGDVVITTPKKVTWDQAILSDLCHRIGQSNENPADYIKISYDVSEAKFNAWPEAIKDEFLPARTVTPGKIKIEIKGA